MKPTLVCCTAMLALLCCVTCQAAAPTYTLTPLGILPGYTESQAVAVNNSGQVAGNLTDSNGYPHAFIYSSGTMTVLNVASGYTRATAVSINNSGEIVGNMFNGSGGIHAFSYANGTMNDLGTLQGTGQSYATGVNASGMVVGSSVVTTPQNTVDACIFPGTDLGIVSGYSSSDAVAINSSGQIVLEEGFGIGSSALFLYANGTATNLNISGTSSSINDSDQIIGILESNGDPFLYSNGTVTDLGSVLGSDYNTTLYGINDSGQIIGVDSSAFIYLNGTRYFLNSLTITGASGWQFPDAEGINVSGQIVGFAFSPSPNSVEEAYLLTPNSSSYTIAVSASPANGGTVSGGGTFATGTLQTVIATADSGYAFTNWTENGAVVSTSTNYTFTLTYNRNLVANFTTNSAFKTLYSFPALISGTNSGGANPWAGLLLSGSTLYGTAVYGGTNGSGAVFAINTDGTGFRNLHSFTTAGSYYPITNSDGANPSGGLILSGDTLYGTAQNGGTNGAGTVFAINTDGTGFTNLYSFRAVSTNSSGIYTNSEGALPDCTLILSGNILYGTASGGGTNGAGTVFAVNTNGTGFTTLHHFSKYSTNSSGYLINGDGVSPYAGLILSGNTLYGTANSGGTNGSGSIFAVHTDGTGLTNLHIFSALINSERVSYSNSDGALPYAGLILSGNTLYGTATYGGTNGFGTVFAINTDGTAFTTLHNFNGGVDLPVVDGAYPYAGLVLSGNILYGMTTDGGTDGDIFAVKTDGTSFTNLYSFTAGGDGGEPYDSLVLSGNTLYGTTYRGGGSNDGVVFSLTIVPNSAVQLAIAHSGADVILTWPTNATVYKLESATNLVSPVVWSSNLPSPVVVNGQNTVTNPISGKQIFYRLSQ